MAGIGSSDFHLADFGFGRLLRLSPLRSNFAECTFTVPTQFESRLYSIFFSGRDPFSIGITFYIHHFLYILSKAQHHLYINMVYKWHDLRFIRLYPSIWIFKYLKPLYVEIQCMHSSLTVSNYCVFHAGFVLTSQTCIMCFTHATYSVIPFRH